MKLCLWMLLSGSVFGQTLTVSSTTAQPGRPVAVDVSYATAGVVAPTALEWVISYPSNDLTLVGSEPAPGPSLQAAGKSLSCKGSWKKAPLTYSFRCIVAGGRAPVPDGVVSTLRFQVKSSVKPGVRAVDLDDASAVTVDAKKVQVRKVAGKLSVVIEAK
jgi:hypothetical protein